MRSWTLVKVGTRNYTALANGMPGYLHVSDKPHPPEVLCVLPSQSESDARITASHLCGRFGMYEIVDENGSKSPTSKYVEELKELSNVSALVGTTVIHIEGRLG